MKDLDSSLIWEIYDKWKESSPLSEDNISREWSEFSSNMTAKYPKLDIEFGDIDYYTDLKGEVSRIIMDPITLYFDFPEHEKHFSLLKKVVKNHPNNFEIFSGDMGFQFEFKEKSFLVVRREAVYKWIDRVLNVINRV